MRLIFVLILAVGCKTRTIENPRTRALTSEASRSNQQDTSSPQSTVNGEVKELVNLYASLEDLQDQIKAQQARNQKLQRSLGIDQISACQKFTNSVEEIEITLNAIPMGNVTSRDLSQGSISDDTTKALFKITVSNADGSKKAEMIFDQLKEDLLDQDRIKILIPSTSMQVQDIEKISISKVNPVFQIIQTNPYQARELQRYLLQRVRVRINNALIYDDSDINFVLAKITNGDERVSGSGMEWVNLNLTTDENFLNFLMGGDCSAI